MGFSGTLTGGRGPPKSSPTPKRVRSRSRLPQKCRSWSIRKDSGTRRTPPKGERSPTPALTKIHVGRLTRNVTKEHVQEIFSSFGTIKMVGLGQDRMHPHLGKGFAYIKFTKADEAETGMKHMDGGQIDEQEITAVSVLSIRPQLATRLPPRSPPPPQHEFYFL